MADNWITVSLFGAIALGVVFATIVAAPILFIIAAFIYTLATG